MCTSEAPASKASCVDSICSAGVTGTAGLSFFFGTAPVMATVMMTGWLMRGIIGREMKKPRVPKSAPVARAPATREPTYEDLLAIVRLVEAGSRFSEVRLRSGDIEVEFKRANGEFGPRASAATAAPGATSHATPVVPDGAPAQMVRDPIPDIPPDAHVIRAPMVGTFYRAPEPGAAPFVEVGSKVKRDSVVCIIEVMKLMNSVTAGVEGEVLGIYAENAQAVEPGQVL